MLMADGIPENSALARDFNTVKMNLENLELILGDWEIIAEGNHHAVLRIRMINDNKKNDKWLLKISKIDESFQVNQWERNDDNKFISNNFLLWFTENYINLPIAILLESQVFINNLNYLLNNSTISNRKEIRSISPYAYLEPNFNFIQRKSINFQYSTLNDFQKHTIGIEIKVKCGLKSTSPFIYNENKPYLLIKYKCSKFKLMQMYKESQKLKNHSNQYSVNWGNFESISEYNPSELCSQNSEYIKNNLNILINNPQNNFKFTFNGQHIHGWNIYDKDAIRKCCDVFLNKNNDHNNDMSLDIIIDLLTKILAKESVLKKIQLLQKLDLIDSEGCDEIYRRLIQLIIEDQTAYNDVNEFSYNQAEIIAKKHIIDSLCEPLNPLYYDLMCDFECVNDNYANIEFKNHVLFQKYVVNGNIPMIVLSLIQHQIIDYSCVETVKMKSIGGWGLLEGLSIQDCVLLLKLWMIALIAKDASIMLAMESQINDISYCYTNDDYIVDVIVQDDLNPGLVELKSIDQPTKSFKFSVSIVDLGMKSLEKFKLVKQKDDFICKECQKLMINVNG
eukprot:gene4799-6727_t